MFVVWVGVWARAALAPQSSHIFRGGLAHTTNIFRVLYAHDRSKDVPINEVSVFSRSVNVDENSSNDARQ